MALSKWCVHVWYVCMCVTFTTVWSTCWSQGGLSKNSSVSIARLLTSVNRTLQMVPPLTCAHILDVTRGNPPGVCVCVYWSAKGVGRCSSAIPHTGGGGSRVLNDKDFR